MRNEDLLEVLNTTIRPALDALGFDADPGHRTAAEMLLLGTGLAESGYRTRTQDGGPALGYWQMEPETHNDCWNNFINYHPDIDRNLHSLILSTTGCFTATPPATRILSLSDKYAAAMARIKYRRSSKPLPAADDYEGMGRMWVGVYNAGGAATIERWRDEVIPVLGALCQPLS